MSTAPRPRTAFWRAMHPMFAELFLDASEDTLLAEEEDQRRSRRARRSRARAAMTTTAHGTAHGWSRPAP